MPAFATPPPHRPNRATFWRDSIYYARVDGLPAKPDSVATMAAAAAYQQAAVGYTHIRVSAFNQANWDSGQNSGYFVDTLPPGTRAADWYTTWSENDAFESPNFIQNRDHIYFPNLRQQMAVKQTNIFLPNFGQYVPGTFGDRHAVCWCEEDRELFECIGYSGFSAACESGVTYDLDSYDMPVGANGTTPLGAIVIRIPVAPFMFTYQDLLDCGPSGDLGHMLGVSLVHYRNAKQWPARGTDGTKPDGPVAGEVFRLPASFNAEALPSAPGRAFARTLKKYGAMLFDTGGQPKFLTPNEATWPTAFTNEMGSLIQLTALETVNISSIAGAPNSIRVASAPNPANVPPIAAMSFAPASGPVPLTVSFDSSASTDGDGTIVTRAWNFGDGNTGSGVAPTHTYTTPGTYTPTLTVTDDDGASNTTTGGGGSTVTAQAVVEPCTLDISGDVVPTPIDPYPLPAVGQRIYMATTGSDSNPGTEASPKRTLFGASGAFAAVPSGGTIIVRGGVYEEGIVNDDGSDMTIRSKQVTIQSAHGEQVWFDGSVEVTGWTGAGPWTKTGWTFNPGNTSGFNSDKPAVTYYFDMLFVDGVPLTRIASGTPAAGQFRVDHAADTVYLGTNPAGKEVRMARYRTLFVTDDPVNLLAIGVRRYANGATSASETAPATRGYEAIYYGGSSAGSRIENCAFVDHGNCPLSIAKADFHVDRNVFVRQGRSHAQIGGSTGCDGLVYTNNEHVGSNRGRWPAEPTAGAVKIVKGDQITVMNNTFRDHPDGHMLWFDQTCTRAEIAGNKCYSTPGRESKTGILWEISGGGFFSGVQYWSYVLKNEMFGLFSYNALTVLDCEWTKVWNNYAEQGDDAIVMIRQDSRPVELTPEVLGSSYNYGAVSFLTNHIEFVNNDMGVGNGFGQCYVWQQADPGFESAGVIGDTMVSRFDGNWFRTPRGVRPPSTNTRACVWGVTETTQQGYDLIPFAAGASALDRRALFDANNWANFQGSAPPAANLRVPIPPDVQAVLDRMEALICSTDPVPSDHEPTAVILPSTVVGDAPLTVDFDGSTSFDSEGFIITDWEWDFDDGATATGETVTHTYTTPGIYNPVLTVTSNDLVAYREVTAFGDSLTAFNDQGGVGSGGRWTERLVADDVVAHERNFGYPGATSEWFQPSWPDPPFVGWQANPPLPPGPVDLLVVFFGANDVNTAVPSILADISGFGLNAVTPAEYNANLDWFLANYPANRQVVVYPWRWRQIPGVPPGNVFYLPAGMPVDEPTYLAYRDAAAQAASDAGAAFVDMGVIVPDTTAANVVTDWIHANAAGHQAIADAIAAAL